MCLILNNLICVICSVDVFFFSRQAFKSVELSKKNTALIVFKFMLLFSSIEAHSPVGGCLSTNRRMLSVTFPFALFKRTFTIVLLSQRSARFRLVTRFYVWDYLHFLFVLKIFLWFFLFDNSFSNFVWGLPSWFLFDISFSCLCSKFLSHFVVLSALKASVTIACVREIVPGDFFVSYKLHPPPPPKKYNSYTNHAQ